MKELITAFLETDLRVSGLLFLAGFVAGWLI